MGETPMAGIKSDGNGGFWISKGAMSFVALLMTALIFLASTAIYAYRDDVSKLTTTDAKHEERIQRLEIMVSQIQNNREDIKEIKDDIREINNKMTVRR